MTELSQPTVTKETVVDHLSERFPDAIQPTEREGHQGVVVTPDQLLAVARHLRDDLGYDYLSSVTAVDYAADGYYEVVYHAYSMQAGGGPVVFKSRAEASDPVLPSLVEVWPSANFQEREAWDLMGVRFDGHPNLKRILTWEGFAGHPLRKDWQEPYYEADKKPFKSRWPKGEYSPVEERTPLGRNVQYPPDFDPDDWSPQAEEPVYNNLQQDLIGDNGQTALDTEEVVVNLGPQHPSTHGVFRMAVKLDGETIVSLEPVMGYLHRNHEKIGERNTWLGNMPYTDRLDYICSMSNNFGYAVAVEKLLDVEVPERAEYIRVIMAEFTRIINHIVNVGFLFNDLGAFFTPMLYSLLEREMILDIFEMVAGSRMMCNYFRFGGVARDMSDEAVALARDLAFDRLPRFIDEYETYLNENEIFVARCRGVSLFEPEQAIAYGVTGPFLRATGVPYDVRRAEPYSIYDRFDFDIPVGTNGDIYDRYWVRIQEVHQSLRILQQALDQMPSGPVQAERIRQERVKPNAGDAYGRVEAPKGELGYYIVSEGKTNPYRYHIRAPSFVNLGALEPVSLGYKIADVVVVLGSVDITLGEVDR